MGDRYTKTILTVIALALIALVLRPMLALEPASAGQERYAQLFRSPEGEPIDLGATTPRIQREQARALAPEGGQTIEAPKSWGRVIAVSTDRVGGLSDQWLWFEDRDGTLRRKAICGDCYIVVRK